MSERKILCLHFQNFVYEFLNGLMFLFLIPMLLGEIHFTSFFKTIIVEWSFGKLFDITLFIFLSGGRGDLNGLTEFN